MDLADLADFDRLLAEGAVQRSVDRGRVRAGRARWIPIGSSRPTRPRPRRPWPTGSADYGSAPTPPSWSAHPQEQDACARYEFLVDRYMASHPLSALCGYGLDLGNETVTEFASLHTAGSSGGAGVPVLRLRRTGRSASPGKFDPVSVACSGGC